MITIEGLSKKQQIIADCFYYRCHTQRDVEAVLHHYGKDARTVYELLTAAALDSYMETDLALELIDYIKSR